MPNPPTPVSANGEARHLSALESGARVRSRAERLIGRLGALAIAAPASRTLALALAMGLVVAFGVGWVWAVGHRGLFVLDQSIVFDGAWRMVQGQVPYRDFYMPFGPVTFALCALMFHLFGVDFSVLVLTAALTSGVAVSLALRVAWLLSARSAVLTLLAGVMTAVWFQAPFGTPWMEQTAFLFDWIALHAVVEARLAARRPSAGYLIAGLATIAAVLSKQNAGGLFLIVTLGVMVAPGADRPWAGRRGLAAFALGAALASAAFAVWLWSSSDVDTFLHYWVDVSSETGMSRVAYWKVLGTLVFQPLLGSSIPILLLCTLVGVGTALVAYAARQQIRASARLALCAWLTVALPQFQSFFQLTTNNEPSNDNAFIGLCVACLGTLLVQAWRAAPAFVCEHDGRRLELRLRRPGLATCTVVLVGALSAYSTGEGLMVAHGRFVQEFAPGTRFDERLAVPGAARLRWGEPTRITPQFCTSLGDMCKISSVETALDHRYDVLDRRDFEWVARVLRARPGNVFVFPDATVLYGLTGHTSPQPLLYFHPGQSYAEADQPALDRTIVAALERNQVNTVVLERASFMGTHKLLASLPALAAWIDGNFELTGESGNYRVLSRTRLARVD